MKWGRVVHIDAETSLGKHHKLIIETIMKQERLWPPGLQDEKNILTFLLRASFKTQHWPEKQGQMLTISLQGRLVAKNNGKVEITDILHCLTDKNTWSHPLLGIMSQNKLLTNANSYVRGCNNNTQRTQRPLFAFQVLQVCPTGERKQQFFFFKEPFTRLEHLTCASAALLLKKKGSVYLARISEPSSMPLKMREMGAK